jgi:hypothetical protein
MPITFHGDLLWIHLWPTQTSYFGVFDGYSSMLDLYGESIRCSGTFYYGPVTYLFFSIFQWIFKGFLPHLGDWLISLQDISLNLETYHVLVENSSPQVFKYLFFMKMPYLFVDTAIFLCLFQWVPEKKTILSWFWAFNPVIIYGTYMVGQFDLMIALVIVLACVAIRKKQYAWAFFSLGLGVVIKKVTIFIFLPTLIILSHDVREFIKNTLFFLCPIVISVGIFYLQSPTVLEWIMPGVIKGKLVGRHSINIEKIIKLVILGGGYLSVIGLCVYSKVRGELRDIFEFLLSIYVIVYLLIYSFLSVAVYYFIWVMPLLVYLSCCDRKYAKCTVILSISIMVYKIKRDAMCLGLFAPINPDLFYAFPSLNDLSLPVEWKNFVKIFRIIFRGTSAYMIYILLKDRVLQRPLSE